MTDAKTAVEALEEEQSLLGEQVGVLYRTFDNMFLVPLNMDIYELAEKWLAQSDKIRKISTSFLSLEEPALIYQLAINAVRPVEAWNPGSYDEEEVGVSDDSDDEWYDSCFKYDIDYTYRQMLVVLYSAGAKLLKVEDDDENLKEMIQAVVEDMNALLEILVAFDTNQRQLTRHTFTAVAALAMNIKGLFGYVYDVDIEAAVN